MEFFDCNCYFGRPSVPDVKRVETARDLLQGMDHAGIGRALVYDVAVRDDSPVVGNELTAEAVAGEERLYPCWGILPPQTELGPVDGFIDAMKTHGVRAVIAFPDEHRYLLNGITFGPLFEAMIAHQVPLLMRANWERVTRLLGEFPSLTVIALEHGSWGEDRYFRPLVERYKNLYLDISRYELDGGIEAFYRRYGSERLVFGTCFPRFAVGGPLLHLLHARIPTTARERIAAGNLDELLGRVKL